MYSREKQNKSLTNATVIFLILNRFIGPAPHEKSEVESIESIET